MVFPTLRHIISTRIARAVKQRRATSDELRDEMINNEGRRVFVVARSLTLEAGFSLIELLAVTAVIALVSAVILTSNSTFGGQVLLRNLAYDIALSVRQAQVYGIAVQRFGSGTFTAGYGIHFDISSPANYLLFGDAITVNGLYDCPTPGSVTTCEQLESNTISNGFKISQLCATPAGGAESCNFTSIDILFKRPDPDAWISATPSGSTPVSCILTGPCYSSARITVRSPRGNTATVRIDQNGQIAVQ